MHAKQIEFRGFEMDYNLEILVGQFTCIFILRRILEALIVFKA